MRLRTLGITSICLIVGLMGHLWYNVQQIRAGVSQRRVHPGEVLGSSLLWDGVEYPLAFRDHVALLGRLNHANPLKQELEGLESAPFSFLIYLADGSLITIQAEGLNRDRLVFRSPDWYEEGMLVEPEPAGLMELVANSHD